MIDKEALTSKLLISLCVVTICCAIAQAQNGGFPTKPEEVCTLLSSAVAARALGGPAKSEALVVGKCSWQAEKPYIRSITYEISGGNVAKPRKGSGAVVVSGVGDAAYFSPSAHIFEASHHGVHLLLFMSDEKGDLIGDAATLVPVARDILSRF